MNKHLAWILPIAGAGVIAYYVGELGIDRLVSAFASMGWGIVVLLTLPLFLFFVHALGWSFTLSPENRAKIGLFRLTALQTFSYGVSGMLPMQAFVSEPLKLAFLKDTDYDKDDFAASLLIDNTINGIAIFAVAAAGMVYLALFLVSGAWIAALILAAVIASLVGFALLILVQKRGLFTAALNGLSRLRFSRRFAERHRDRAERIDGRVRSFYQHNPRGFFIAFVLHIVEKAQGVAELWLIFHLLGMDVSWGSCFFIFAVISTLDNVLFFIQVGGMEAWTSSLLVWMEITRDNINVTAALFRRVRFLFWALAAVILILPTRRLFVRAARENPVGA